MSERQVEIDQFCWWLSECANVRDAEHGDVALAKWDQVARWAERSALDCIEEQREAISYD